MPRFIIERNFAEQLEVDNDAKIKIKEVNDEEGIEWIFSFLSADKRKTYCLYEAPDEASLRQAAQRLNIPADVITPVDRLDPGIFA
jgi:Nickel responsive protein SCO4226-like